MNKWTSVGFSYFRRIDRVGPAMRNVYNLCDEGLLWHCWDLRPEPCSLSLVGRPSPSVITRRSVSSSLGPGDWLWRPSVKSVKITFFFQKVHLHKNWFLINKNNNYYQIKENNRYLHYLIVFFIYVEFTYILRLWVFIKDFQEGCTNGEISKGTLAVSIKHR